MLGKILVMERKKKSMTVKAFAQFLEISPLTLFAWENGAIPRRPEQLMNISKRLELSLLYLMFGEEAFSK